MNNESVFTLVNSIGDFRQVYASLGCGHIVGSAKEKRSWPCPKADSTGSSKSTKFRLARDFDVTGKCIHNDVNDGHYMDVIDYVSWMFNCDKVDAAKQILDVVGIDYDNHNSGGRSSVPVKQTEKPEVIAAKKQAAYNDGVQKINLAQKVWKQGLPLTEPVARDLLNKYLIGRGLPDGHVDLMPKSLRVNTNLLYPKSLRDTDKSSHAWYAGVLLPLVDDCGQPVTIHRHYFLKETGDRIPESNKKLMMSPPWSLLPGTKMIYDEPLVWEEDGIKSAVIAIGEGMETMEAVRAATGLPVQPMYSSSLLQGYVPPHIDGVTPNNMFLAFFVDKDIKKAGEKSAMIAIERLTALGYQCEMLLPPMDIPEGAKGVDWLDQWCLTGSADFPENYML